MPSILYQDFYLIIQPPDEQGRYRAQVLGSSGGTVEDRFTRAEIFGPLPARPNGPAPDAPTRKAELVLGGEMFQIENLQPPTLAEAKALGGHIFNAVFKREIYGALRRSLDQARNNRAHLRLRLNLTNVPELAALPWELLFNDKINHFYAQSIESPVVRYINVGEPSERVTVEGPLRILVMVADVPQLAQLDVEEEWRRLTGALAKLVAAGQVEVERLSGNSASALSEHLMQRRDDRPYHVFHFIGHGAYNPSTHESSLLMMDASGQQMRALSAERLSGMLQNHRSLRLVVLNSCEGARTDETDSYTGAAQSLIRQATIPAVIAMQYRITDKAAIDFSYQFYSGLVAGLPIEAALSNGRSTIFAEGNDVEWATPVLFMRAEDGQLFEPREPRLAPAPTRVNSELDEHYQAVVRVLLDGRLVPFLGLDVNLYGRLPQPRWQPGANLPSSRELATYLAGVFAYPTDEPLDLISVCQYAAVNREGLSNLYDELKSIFNHHHEVTPLHRFFAGLPAVLREKGYQGDDELRLRFVVATTTYDNLLERAFKEINQAFHVVSYVISGEQSGRFFHAKFAGATQISPPTQIADPNNYPPLSDADPIILKLPGAVESVEQRFAIIEDHFSDYLTYKDLSGLLPPQLKGKLKLSHHLFLGSGLRNWHLRALLYRIWESRRANRGSWAVHPEPQPIDERFWRAAGVQPLLVDFETYVGGLRERLDGVPIASPPARFEL
ncbi:MAG TPA: CHAT domain-containing protein [Pyrinomonadaceae bacterium]|nr:CHAT domain-containing protein [Pyrinomonadaceae bacterium]